MRFVRLSLYAGTAVAATLILRASPPAVSANAACETCGKVRWPVKTLAPGLDSRVVNADNPLIAEIPKPTCESACRSSFKPRYADARQSLLAIPAARHFLQTLQLRQQQLDARYGAGRQIARGVLDPPIKVRVKGVKFFDRVEHGVGASRTGIEVHPVYALVALPGACKLPPQELIRGQFQIYQAESQLRQQLN